MTAAQKRQEASPWLHSVTAMLQGGTMGAVGALVLQALVALLCFVGVLPVAAGEYSAPAAALIGAFVGGGYTMKKVGARAARLNGAAAGVMMFLLLLSISLLLYQKAPNAAGGGMILACCLCGGGVAGLLLRRSGKKRRR
ncbi:MAG: TIGR04086 family membrane protein [Oscillospiraceae bacterium]|nr:TIGR04086 family membrane protein [Oscillospiraceae bacterium]